MKTEDQLIDEYLAQCDDFSDEWLGAEVTAEEIVRESDASWDRYMKLFRETLKRNGLGEREDLVSSKNRVNEGWLRAYPNNL